MFFFQIKFDHLWLSFQRQLVSNRHQIKSIAVPINEFSSERPNLIDLVYWGCVCQMCINARTTVGKPSNKDYYLSQLETGLNII